MTSVHWNSEVDLEFTNYKLPWASFSASYSVKKKLSFRCILDNIYTDTDIFRILAKPYICWALANIIKNLKKINEMQVTKDS